MKSSLLRKFTLTTVTALIISCLAAQSIEESIASESDLIRNTYDQYNAAVKARDVVLASQLISSKTISYYEMILQHTRDSDSLLLDEQTIMDKMMILALRHRKSDDNYAGFDGLQLYRYTLENGMIGSSSLDFFELDSVNVNDDIGEAYFTISGRDDVVVFEFSKEGGRWKIDLSSVLDLGNESFIHLINETGMEENEYIRKYLELTYDDVNVTDLWKPIQN